MRIEIHYVYTESQLRGMDDKMALVEHAEDMGRTSVGRNINSKYRNRNGKFFFIFLRYFGNSTLLQSLLKIRYFNIALDNLTVFCVEVPSIYDQRSLRSLTQEEICERYGGDRRLLVINRIS